MGALRVPLGSPRQSLTVEPLVGNRPAEVLRCQHLTAVDTIVHPLVSVGCVDDGGLVCPALCSFLWESGGDDCGHSAIALEPGAECSDRRLAWTRSARSFLTTFGGTMADGLNGPRPCSPRSSGSLLLRAGAGLVWSINAADAKMSRPQGVGPRWVQQTAG